MTTPLRFTLLLTLASSLGCTAEPAPATDAGPDRADAGAGSDAGDEADGSASDAPGSDAAAVDPCAGGACDPCDTGLALDDADATDAARAMGVCSGLFSAAWELPDGTVPPRGSSFPLGHGLLDDFGALTPREGARLLGLSTGTARSASDPGWVDPAGFDKGYTSGPPAGFPVEAPACPGVVTDAPHDGVALSLTLDVPAGANGFRFLVKHHTYEFPAFLCSSFNDVAAVIVDPAPPGAAPSGDVTIDAAGNPLSVNSSFIDVCTCAGGPPCDVGGRTFACAAGASELAGTGFDGASDTGAATRWLEVRVPATAGSRVELRIALWDSGDGVLDSTLLVDGFRWLTDAPSSAETRVLAP